VKKINDRSVVANLYAATVAFGLFAFFSGLVVPHESVGWLSHILNAGTFRSATGLPIELFRTATALLSTISITSMLGIFDLEKQRQVTESRRLEAVYKERERFARDLHDDVIQSIYAVGLDLQTSGYLIDRDSDRASRQITTSVERLNKVIHTLRAYIKGLESKGSDQDFKDSLINLIEQFKRETGLQVSFNFPLSPGLYIQPEVDAEDWQQQLRQVIREALNNVVRHSGATMAEVDIRVEGGILKVLVKDNGRGFSSREDPGDDGFRTHLGLRNMRTRVMLLGGEFNLLSGTGKGTGISITIPLNN
jgi:signal transduction histidine kinase